MQNLKTNKRRRIISNFTDCIIIYIVILQINKLRYFLFLSYYNFVLYDIFFFVTIDL